jgi:hypothetical protein
MSHETYHEPYELLSQETTDMHRAVVSMMEELEAIDWYQQRAEACADEELKAILLHNKDEEVEHALMTLEWMRRKSPRIAEMARRYLFTEGPIVAVEEDADSGETRRQLPGGSLHIGSLRTEVPR